MSALPCLAVLAALPVLAAPPPLTQAKVRILSTMLSDRHTGEWGFAALVEAGGTRVLVDTGARPRTVLDNAKELGIDLSSVTDVVLTHWHGDHTGGLLTLRRELMKKNPAALSRAHVGPGFFRVRREKGEVLTDQADLAREYRALGGTFVDHPTAAQLAPGVWLTGGVPRLTAEQNYPKTYELQQPDGGWALDDVPDDLALVLDTVKGLVVVVGCGHAGVINTLEAAKKRVREGPVAAVVGGLHLFPADDGRVEWTATELSRLKVGHLIGAHCTGIEALPILRKGAGLDRKTAVVGAVGASYDLDAEIDPGTIAR